MSKIQADEISSIIKERIDNFELNVEGIDNVNNTNDLKERGITIYGAINAVKPLVAEIANKSNIKVVTEEEYLKIKASESKQLLSYCAVNEYMPYMGSPRRRDSLPKEEQLRKIALAQQKRERKALRKTK